MYTYMSVQPRDPYKIVRPGYTTTDVKS